jgi:DNA-binding CsgD family transcriptional regulator
MVMGSWQLEQLERAFADAALDPAGWNKAMNTAAFVTGAAGAVLLPITGAQIPEVPCSDRTGEANEAYFRDRWYEQDERSKGIPLLVKNGLVDDLDLFNERYINRHPYYQDFLTPFGFRWFVGVRVAFGDDVWCLSIQRTITQGPFSGSQKKKLLRLSQTLSASAALAKAIGFAASGATLDALEASGSAALLIDRQGDVFQMNPSAELMLKGEVRVVNRRLVAQDARSTAAFDRALHDLIWRRSDAALSPPVVLNRAGQYPLLAYLVKPSAWAANTLADCKAIAILVEVGARTRLPEKTLRSVFDLTDAEARLAVRLGSGQALEDIANELGLTKETVRSHLKSIFSKTSTHRQGDLVSLLSPLGIGRK